MSGIYAYYFNGELIYIGQSKNIKERIQQHFYNAKNGNAQQLIDKIIAIADNFNIKPKFFEFNNEDFINFQDDFGLFNSDFDFYECMKLFVSMQGLLVWEVLEFCEETNLLERESYYINLNINKLLNKENCNKQLIFNKIESQLTEYYIESEIYKAEENEKYIPFSTNMIENFSEPYLSRVLNFFNENQEKYKNYLYPVFIKGKGIEMITINELLKRREQND